MKTKTIKLYTFDELSEDAKQNAVDEYLSKDYNHEYFGWQDAQKTMETFADNFNVIIRDYDIGHRGNGIKFRFSDNEEFDPFELKGIRLYKYLVNNYSDVIESYEKGTLKYSTGYCFDYDIIKPILDFIKRPDKYEDFHSLINYCFQSFEKAVLDDMEYQTSYDCIADQLSINDYEFTEDGKLYTY